MSIALVLGGGAPNLTLMSGALLALHEKGMTFDVISTSGAGSLVGLVYAAPRSGDVATALQDTMQMGVADAIYRTFPINYKVFKKPGIWADSYRQAFKDMVFPGIGTCGGLFSIPEPMRHWVEDSMQLAMDWCSPTSLHGMSQGLSAHCPFIEDMVDFEALKTCPSDFFLNAYNITDRRMEYFGKTDITPDHFRACLSMPFIYPPFELNGKKYYEGAAKECLSYTPLIGAYDEVDTVIVFDILGHDELIHEPHNLYDAWVMSIIMPLVSVAKQNTDVFKLKHNVAPNRVRQVLKIPFEIPERCIPNILDWSRSNMANLFEIGYKSGLHFYSEHRAQFDLSLLATKNGVSVVDEWKVRISV